MNSRTHATIDFGVTAGLLILGLVPRVLPRVRWTALAAAAAQTGYGALTDYEAGVAPRLSFARHRQIDLLGGAVLGLAGAGLRSPALFAAGATTVGSALLTSTHGHGAPEVLYHPLDTPKPFGSDLWLVDGAFGPGVPVRMTVVRLPGGDLLLHSPTQITAGLRGALEALGPIRHLVAPNSVHWTFVKAWQVAFPDATVWAAPGLRERGQVKRSGLRIDTVLSDTPPAAWGGVFEQQVIPGGAGFREVAMLHRPSRTLLMTDLVQSFETGKLPWVLRPLARLLGNTTAESRAPAHLRAVVRFGNGTAAARRVVGWEPERIVVTHGRPIVTDAAARLRRSLAWLTDRR